MDSATLRNRRGRNGMTVTVVARHEDASAAPISYRV